MNIALNMASFVAYFLDDFDLGFTVLPNVVVAAIISTVVGLLIRQSLLSYCGVFLIFFYYLLIRLGEMV